MVRLTSIALLLLACCSAVNTADAERFDARSWRRVKTYDMAKLQKLDPPIGRVLGVKFNYRHEDIRHLKPNWYYASIWHVVRGQDSAEFMHITVMVPAEALESFKALPADFRSQHTYVMYGEILRDADAGFPFLRAIGTKVKRGKGGKVTVKW
jgi:hypothetical protein